MLRAPTADLTDLVLLAVALALGVAGVVLSVLDDAADVTVLVALGLVALALRGLRQLDPAARGREAPDHRETDQGEELSP